MHFTTLGLTQTSGKTSVLLRAVKNEFVEGEKRAMDNEKLSIVYQSASGPIKVVNSDLVLFANI